MLSFAWAIAACSDDEEPPSTAELLNELEGRELSPAEVAERQQVAELLCRLDDAVLTQIWDRLSTPQLEFQDFVFGRVCQDRSALYAEVTGRFIVNED